MSNPYANNAGPNDLEYGYIKVQFVEGLSGDYYQQVDSTGNVVAYLDSSGNPVSLPNITDSMVIDPNPPQLSWMV